MHLRLLLCLVSLQAFQCCSSFSQNYYDLGLKEYYTSDNLNGAIELFTKSIENNQEVARSYMMRGAAKAYMKQYVQSFDDLNQSLKLDSTNYKTYFYIGRNYFMQEFYSTALKYFDKEIAMNTTDADAYDQRAMCKIINGDFAGAINDEDNAIKIDTTGESSYYVNRGYAKFLMKKYKEAIDDYDISIKLGPIQKAYADKGLALAKLNRHEEAIIYYTQSLSLIADDGEVLYNRGVSYKYLKNFDLACNDFTKSAALNYPLAMAAKNIVCIKK